MAPRKETTFYCLFAMNEEDFGEERWKLEDFSVGLDEGLYLGKVSIMHLSGVRPRASVAQDVAAGHGREEVEKDIPRYPIICTWPPCFAMLRA